MFAHLGFQQHVEETQFVLLIYRHILIDETCMLYHACMFPTLRFILPMFTSLAEVYFHKNRIHPDTKNPDSIFIYLHDIKTYPISSVLSHAHKAGWFPEVVDLWRAMQFPGHTSWPKGSWKIGDSNH